MKKIKVIVTILYVAFAVEILGAWNHTPRAKETAAYVAPTMVDEVVRENQQVIREQNAQLLYAKQRALELERSNEYRVLANEKEVRQQERAWEKEQKRRRRVREKRQEEREILERIVEAEAGGQNLKGRILVANVILNRVKSERFPDTVKAVVFAHRQFSPVQNGRYYEVTVSKTTKKAVKLALNGTDYSEGALYFMCRSASDPDNVAWFDRDLTKVKEYGCHEFFK